MTNETPKSSLKARFSIKRIALAALALLALLISARLFMPGKLPPGISLGDSWVFRENQSGPVIGNLGGVPVAIPRPYAHLVEYDDDPGFMEPRKGPSPTRTYQSKPRSFGFEVRFPDMEPLTDKNLSEKRKTTIYNTMWMRVGVSSNSDYGFNAEHPMSIFVKNRSKTVSQHFPYERLPAETHGLIGYTPIGVDLSRRNLGGGGADMYDKNIYYHQDKDGEADVYIECSNMEHAAARCEQHFVLPSMRSWLRVNYRRELLPHWRQIQTSVTQIIVGFRVNPKSISESN